MGDWVWLVIGIVTIVVVLTSVTVIVWGAFLPMNHVASRALVINAPPEEVWRVIDDVGAMSSWRTGLSKVEIKDLIPESRAWVEHSKQGRMPLRVVRREPPNLLVVRIDTDKLPFGGTWTYQLQPVGSGRASLRITENGFVKPPPFRFLAKFVFGTHKTIEGYLRDLGRRFGGEVKIET